MVPSKPNTETVTINAARALEVGIPEQVTRCYTARKENHQLVKRLKTFEYIRHSTESQKLGSTCTSSQL